MMLLADMSSYVWSFFTEFSTWFQQQIKDYGVDLKNIDFVKQFTGLASYMKLINSILPIEDGFHTLFNGLKVKAGIRVVRWILSCIPTSNQ